MVRDDRLTILAKAAGFSLIPPQEIYSVTPETSLDEEEGLSVEKKWVLLYIKIKNWFLSSSNDPKIRSRRKYLINWIQNLVHV